MLIAPPPPPTLTRPVFLLDTECYPNYWLLKFRDFKSGITLDFELIGESSRFEQHIVARLAQIFQVVTVISFNGNNYDVPMILAAMQGYTAADLKRQNDMIIVNGLKPWELPLPRWQPADHIDIMEVIPGQGSQKVYAGRIHSKTMRDLPYDPAMHLTFEQMQQVSEYCGNDLQVLGELYTAVQPQLDMRVSLGERYGLDLRSKSDAQVAEAVLRARCEKVLGRRIQKPVIDPNFQFQFKTPHFIKFSTPVLQGALDAIQRSVFKLNWKGEVEMPPALDNLQIPIGGSVYRMGIGGLHSSESGVSHYTDADNVLRDNDVASYYPTLILNSGEYPPALGATFRQEYQAIKDERLASKALAKQLKKQGGADYIKAVTEDGGGKIMLNGTFGKTGSPYSILNAPTMLIQTTISGQLSLLMLIERLELAGIPVVSANTDGIVTKCPRALTNIHDAIIQKWQIDTGLEMETVEYKSIHSRDVNNYFAVKTDGDVKRKGAYANGGLNEKINPSCDIVADAVAALLSNGTPIELTIGACTDIRKFVTIRKVNGGAIKRWGHAPAKDAKIVDMVPTLERNGWVKVGRLYQRGNGQMKPRDAYATCFPPQREEFIGKVVRWYYSTQAPGCIHYATNGNTVSLSNGSMPCMVLPDTLPTDIDYQYYINAAYEILIDIGVTLRTWTTGDAK